MAIIDSQSVKTTERGGPRGKEAHKKVNGRKRRLVVDTLGMVVSAVVHSAGIQDRDGAKFVLGKMVGRFPRLKKILAKDYEGSTESSESLIYITMTHLNCRRLEVL